MTNPIPIAEDVYLQATEGILCYPGNVSLYFSSKSTKVDADSSKRTLAGILWFAEPDKCVAACRIEQLKHASISTQAVTFDSTKRTSATTLSRSEWECEHGVINQSIVVVFRWLNTFRQQNCNTESNSTSHIHY